MLKGRLVQGQPLFKEEIAKMSISPGLYLTYVLFGTYDLLRMMNLNAQLARRSLTLPFPRYRADQPDVYTLN
jgi:hypothetical protein